MVTRIVTALVAIPIGILIVALNNEILYYVAMTAFSVIAVYEMLVTTKYLKNKFTSAVSLIFAAVTPIILDRTAQEQRKADLLRFCCNNAPRDAVQSREGSI